MQLIKQLEASRDETLGFFSLPEDDLARTYGPGKWPVRYLLLHLSDSEAIFYDRVRRVLSEPRQVLWVYDQDAFAAGLEYSRLPLEVSRRVYESVREAIIYYAGQYYDSKRTARVRAQRDRGANAEAGIRQGRLTQRASPATRSEPRWVARQLSPEDFHEGNGHAVPLPAFARGADSCWPR